MGYSRDSRFAIIRFPVLVPVHRIFALRYIQGPDDPKPTYTFELTTNFFAIDSSGVLVVNEENLDRDPPSPGRFRFQVVAREKTGVAASSPLSFVVTLNDVNDNAPLLPMTAPITVQAGETKRQVTKVSFLISHLN